MLPLMNYWHAFRWIYALLAIVWITAILFSMPRDQLRFWVRDLIVDADLTTPRSLLPVRTRIWIPEDQISHLPPGYKLVRTFTSRTTKAQQILRVVFLPPAAAMLTLFFIAPWIYRKVRTQT